MAAALYLLVSLVQTTWLLPYAGGDLALSLLPLLLMFAFIKHRGALTKNTLLHLLVVVTSFAAIEARLIGVDGSRFAPPSAFLLAASWYLLLQAKTVSGRVLSTGLTATVGYLAYSSGYRTHFLLWLISPIVVLALVGGWRRVLLLTAALGIGLSLFSFAGRPLDLSSSLADSRFQALLNGQQDVSLSTRFEEVQDVQATARAEWAPGQILVGSGFGASYVPAASNILRNLLDGGRVHNIHIGPALVYFRYGLLGLAVMATLLVFLLRMGLRIRRRIYMRSTRDMQAVLWCSLALFLLQFLTLNATVEPLMSLSLGGLLAIWAVERQRPPPEPNAT